MYSKILKNLTTEFPNESEILNNYSEATDFDKCVILLRSMKLVYGQISAKLGSPSKKAIRASLLQ
jgi:hypothetical protein